MSPVPQCSCTLSLETTTKEGLDFPLCPSFDARMCSQNSKTAGLLKPLGLGPCWWKGELTQTLEEHKWLLALESKERLSPCGFSWSVKLQPPPSLLHNPLALNSL